MQKVKSVLDRESYSTTVFLGASSTMVLCFIAGAALISFSLGRAGYIVMAVGLMISMFVWSVFFD